jgi:hypothetical protein
MISGAEAAAAYGPGQQVHIFFIFFILFIYLFFFIYFNFYFLFIIWTRTAGKTACPAELLLLMTWSPASSLDC